MVLRHKRDTPGFPVEPGWPTRGNGVGGRVWAKVVVPRMPEANDEEDDEYHRLMAELNRIERTYRELDLRDRRAVAECQRSLDDVRRRIDERLARGRTRAIPRR